MADFQHYAAPSKEWTEFEKTWSPRIPPAGTSIEDSKIDFNTARAKLFAEYLGPVGQLLVATFNFTQG